MVWVMKLAVVLPTLWLPARMHQVPLEEWSAEIQVVPTAASFWKVYTSFNLSSKRHTQECFRTLANSK